MSIDRVNIQTTSFRLQASNIRGPQLRTLVDRLSRAAGAQPTASPARLSGSLAMQSPAARFNDLSPALAGASGLAAGSAAGSADGFAPGGAESLSSLDVRGLMNLVMSVMQRLVDAIVRMISGAGGGSSDGCSGSSDSGAAGGASNGQATTASVGTPTKPSDLATRFASRDPGSSSGGTPGSCTSATSAAHSRERPGGVGRLLARIGKGALAVGANAVPGGGLAAAALSSCGAGGASPSGGSGCAAPGSSGGGPSPASTGSCERPSSAGGSLEDRIFAFLTEKLREIEQELEGAMNQADAAGGSGGDSRSAATQKVQQLVQKRSEMVELLSNSLKTMHDSTQAVNRNIRT